MNQHFQVKVPINFKDLVFHKFKIQQQFLLGL